MSDFEMPFVVEEKALRILRIKVNNYYNDKFYFRFGTYCKNKTGYRNKFGRYGI